MVGTNQGTVYQSREGYGGAAIIDTKASSAAFAATQAERQAKEAAKAEEQKAAKADFDAKMKAIESGEVDFQHQASYNKRYNALTETAAKLIQSGKNPFGYYDDPEVKAFRQEYNAIQAAGKAGKMQKEWRDKMSKHLNTHRKNASESFMQSYAEFSSIDPFELSEGKFNPPEFEAKEPIKSVFNYVNNITSELQKKAGGVVDDANIEEAAESFLRDERAEGTGVLNGIKKILGEMTGEEIDELESRSGGKGAAYQYLVDEMKKANQGKTYSYDKFSKDMVKELSAVAKYSKDEIKGYAYRRVTPRQIREYVTSRVMSGGEAYRALQARFGGATKEETAKLASESIIKNESSLFKNEYIRMDSEDASGAGKPNDPEAAKNWLQALYRGDSNASGFLENMKLPDGSIAKGVSLADSKTIVKKIAGKRIPFRADSNFLVIPSEVYQKIGTDEEDFKLLESEGGGYAIEVSPENEERLRDFYYKAAAEKKSAFKGASSDPMSINKNTKEDPLGMN